MSLNELKIEVLQKVIQTDDEGLLAQLKNMLSSSQQPNDFADDFSPNQLASIERGKAQLEDGKGIPMEEFVAKLQNRKR